MPAKGGKQPESAKRAIGAKTGAWWSSPEGEALKAKMREERTGRRRGQTEAHKRAMDRRRRIYEAGRLVVEAEEGPDPFAVTDEERAVAALEGGGPPPDAAGKDPVVGAGPDRSKGDELRTGS
ncbi:MAG: hypothetical protein ACRDHS_03040 [Actinomycetota bacterium]